MADSRGVAAAIGGTEYAECRGDADRRDAVWCCEAWENLQMARELLKELEGVGTKMDRATALLALGDTNQAFQMLDQEVETGHPRFMERVAEFPWSLLWDHPRLRRIFNGVGLRRSSIQHGTYLTLAGERVPIERIDSDYPEID